MSRFYATTPIYYVNDAPHVGHSYTTIIVDALTRWHRLLGDDVWSLTGTDEHGLKIQRSAEAAGRTPQEQVDLHSAAFRDAWAELNLANDDFIRTTEPRHFTAVATMLSRAYDNGYVYKDTYEGWYCVRCEAYYEPDDLFDDPDAGIENGCPIHKAPAEWMTEENWFFRLSAFQQRLEAWFEADPDNITPTGFRNEAAGILRQGLQDISMSRSSISWGIPVPWDPDHVFYVWYDALINYATAVGYGSDPDRFADWWPATHHVIGKDIIRFHTIYWPAMLMAAGIEEMPKFHVHGFLLLGGEKMSKSGNVTKIAPTELTGVLGVDGYRHALLRNHPFGPDSEFSYEGMVERYNVDLANNYGNLISRVATVVAKKCDGIGPAPRPDSPLATQVSAAVGEVIEAWDRVQPSVALEATIRIVRETNEFLADNEPWKMDPGPQVQAVMGDAIEATRVATVLLAPAMPTAVEAAWKRLGLPGTVAEQRIPVAAEWGGYPGGLAVATGDPLFPRVKG